VVTLKRLHPGDERDRQASVGSVHVALLPTAPGEATPTGDVEFFVDFELGPSFVNQVRVIVEFGSPLDRDHDVLGEAVPP
jgi:hypothetical protein